VEKKRTLILGLLAGLLITLAFIGGCIPTTTPEGGEGAGSIAPLIIFLVLIFGMMYFLMIRPQRKKQKEHQELMAELRRGDKVITAGGIYGVVETTSDESVVIKVEDGTMLRVARNSVAGKRER